MWHSNRVASPFFFFLDFQYPPNQFLVSGTAYGHQRVIYKRNSFVKFRRMANPCLLTGEPADSCRSSLMDGRFAALVRRIPRLVAWLCRRLEVLKGLTRRFVMEKCWSVGGGGFYQQSVSVANIIIAIRICGNFKGGGDIFWLTDCVVGVWRWIYKLQLIKSWWVCVSEIKRRRRHLPQPDKQMRKSGKFVREKLYLLCAHFFPTLPICASHSNVLVVWLMFIWGNYDGASVAQHCWTGNVFFHAKFGRRNTRCDTAALMYVCM